jgi:Rhodanese-related sulfurtransferase
MSAATIPNVLVTTDWVAQHAADTGVRVVEVDVDTTAYDQGHVPGAAGWNWTTELCDTLIRDIVPIKKLEELLGKSGIDNKTTIVLYGDNNNWFAAWAFWQLKIYGHEDVRIMDGGRKKWVAEGKELTPTSRLFRRRLTRRAHPISRFGRFYPKCNRRWHKSRLPLLTCGVRRNSPERSSLPLGFRRPVSVAATFRERRAFPGPRHATTMGRSKAPATSRRCTEEQESLLTSP